MSLGAQESVADTAPSRGEAIVRAGVLQTAFPENHYNILETRQWSGEVRTADPWLVIRRKARRKT